MTSIPESICDPEKRHDFLLLVDGSDTNPNGDPDGGRPRQDFDTREGLMSSQSVKRKVRDYVMAVKRNERERYDIFYRTGKYIAENLEAAFDKADVGSGSKDDLSDELHKARNVVLEKYFDVRTFGIVPTKTISYGKKRFESVTGPVQLGMGRSLDPVDILDHSLTRTNRNKPEDGVSNTDGQMGSNSVIRYGMYKIEGSYEPFRNINMDASDLRLVWEGLWKGWSLSQSASRMMHPVRLVVFSHDKPLGDANAYNLFRSVKVESGSDMPTSREDYDITIPAEVPEGVQMTVLGA